MQGQSGGECLLWPSSEQSQVPLAHITSCYSCHQAQASGAERLRGTEQIQGKRGRGTTDKKDWRNFVKVCRHVRHYNYSHLYHYNIYIIILVAAEQSGTDNH